MTVFSERHDPRLGRQDLRLAAYLNEMLIEAFLTIPEDRRRRVARATGLRMEGKSEAAIASELGVDVRTVHRDRMAIVAALEKLGVHPWVVSDSRGDLRKST